MCCWTVKHWPFLGCFYHIGKHQKRLVQAHKVLCESVLQAITSSQSFRLSSPNGMKAGRTNSPWPYNSMKPCQTIYRSMQGSLAWNHLRKAFLFSNKIFPDAYWSIKESHTPSTMQHPMQLPTKTNVLFIYRPCTFQQPSLMPRLSLLNKTTMHLSIYIYMPCTPYWVTHTGTCWTSHFPHTIMLQSCKYYIRGGDSSQKWRGLINIHESWLYARSEFSNVLINMLVPQEH